MARPSKTFENMTLTCVDCGQAFVHSAGEQAFFAERNLPHLPKRCHGCREAGRRLTCGDCGGEAVVPFKPVRGDPVYCNTCWPKHKRAE
jgi:CxxC-x17-CxxC domain-containing protein